MVVLGQVEEGGGGLPPGGKVAVGVAGGRREVEGGVLDLDLSDRPPPSLSIQTPLSPTPPPPHLLLLYLSAVQNRLPLKQPPQPPHFFPPYFPKITVVFLSNRLWVNLLGIFHLLLPEGNSPSTSPRDTQP